MEEKGIAQDPIRPNVAYDSMTEYNVYLGDRDGPVWTDPTPEGAIDRARELARFWRGVDEAFPIEVVAQGAGVLEAGPLVTICGTADD